jgi:hypothetical protein
MVPFVNGLHLTIDKWRPDRDSEGWKLSLAQIDAKYVTDNEIEIDLEESMRPVVSGKPPLKAKAAGRLNDDIDVLLTMMEDERTPLRMIRARALIWGKKYTMIMGNGVRSFQRNPPTIGSSGT